MVFKDAERDADVHFFPIMRALPVEREL